MVERAASTSVAAECKSASTCEDDHGDQMISKTASKCACEGDSDNTARANTCRTISHTLLLLKS